MESYSNHSLAEAYLDVYRNLNEEFKDLTPEKEELVRGRHAQLASDIFKNHDEITRLSKRPLAKFRPSIKRKIRELIRQSKHKYKLSQNASDALLRTGTSRSAELTKKIEDIKHQLPKNKIIRFQREDYEYLISYLLDEGYVDNLKSAEAIIESMSNQWLNAILNESGSLSDMFKSASDDAYAADMEAHEKAMASIKRMKQLFRDAGYDVDSKPENKPSPSSNERMSPQQRAAKMREKIDKAMEVMDKQDRQYRRN